MRKWPFMLGLALLAAALAAFHVLGKDANDFLWGLAGGIAIGTVFVWISERGLP